jgi:glycosyltransferase involved in cell wall biosynthesis
LQPQGYVCAFRGRRDNYQIPLALQEAGKLAAFVTDAYATAPIMSTAHFAPEWVSSKISARHLKALNSKKVCCLWSPILFEKLLASLGYSASNTNAKLDPIFGRAAIQYAKKRHANLFLYSPYAWEAFNEHVPFDIQRYLFQYHPHFETECKILQQDAATYPKLFPAYSKPGSNKLECDQRVSEDNCWRLSDKIICASSFTRKSLLDAGADSSKITVIPYGVDLPAIPTRSRDTAVFNVVFVGSGVQRKGLHHLLIAWGRVGGSVNGQLTLVCRNMDPSLAELARATPKVTLLRGLGQGQLVALYGSATLFAMPSLVEGFGQVYLEALSFGLPVLGTKNTCLPDLGDESDGIFCVEPGEIDALSAMLLYLARLLPDASGIADRTRSCAARFTWPRFRGRIGSLL